MGGGELSDWRNLPCVCSLQTLLLLISERSIVDDDYCFETKQQRQCCAGLFIMLVYVNLYYTQVGREISRDGGGVDYEEC